MKTTKAKPIPLWLKAWCQSVKAPLPVAEYRFCERKWRFDFCWPEDLIAVEFHGSVWVQGRHTRGKGFLNDRAKMNTAQLLGWRVGEFETKQVAECIAWLERLF